MLKWIALGFLGSIPLFMFLLMFISYIDIVKRDIKDGDYYSLLFGVWFLLTVIAIFYLVYVDPFEVIPK